MQPRSQYVRMTNVVKREKSIAAWSLQVVFAMAPPARCPTICGMLLFVHYEIMLDKVLRKLFAYFCDTYSYSTIVVTGA